MGCACNKKNGGGGTPHLPTNPNKSTVFNRIPRSPSMPQQSNPEGSNGPQADNTNKGEWRQIMANFATSMLKWAREGLKTVPSQQHMERYRKCNSCEKFSNYRCSECGCVCWLKTKLATEKCPLNKW